MAAIKVQPGCRVKIKSLGTIGTVRDLEAVKSPSGRGRPRTYATVDLEDGGAGRVGIPDLALV